MENTDCLDCKYGVDKKFDKSDEVTSSYCKKEKKFLPNSWERPKWCPLKKD